ncbi:MAG: glycoside hydrolase family 43 protein [Planctomycetia bacterium]|nr:glycoside hydrolase family 43 protein [Planctomycetia bacterium]
MNTKIKMKAIIFCLCFACALPLGAQTNLLPNGEIWSDENGVHINAHGGGILFHDGRYYWFGEHKIEGTAGNLAHVGVHCYSSSDLRNWTDEGIALHVSDNPESDIARGRCILERPKVIYNAQTKKFVMWFHLEVGGNYQSARSGVAVADCVTGPYQFLRSMRINEGFWPMNVAGHLKELLRPDEVEYIAELRLTGGFHPDYPRDMVFRRDFIGGQMARDMTLFVDDDGKAYHIYSSEENGTLHIAELADDYLSHSGAFVRIFPGRFHEAPAIFKKDGKYFLFASGCTGWAPNAARLATAERIMGEWTELGNPCRGSKEECETTFRAQSTFVLKVHDKDEWIFMADRWCPNNAIDGRYVWIPIRFDAAGTPYLTLEENEPGE